MAERPIRFEHNRFVGDKRTLVVYDMDDEGLDPAIVDELMKSERFTCFGPDTLAEARNRGYKLYGPQRGRVAAQAAQAAKA